MTGPQVPAGRGLVVNVSSVGGLKYAGCVAVLGVWALPQQPSLGPKQYALHEFTAQCTQYFLAYECKLVDLS